MDKLQLLAELQTAQAEIIRLESWNSKLSDENANLNIKLAENLAVIKAFYAEIEIQRQVIIKQDIAAGEGMREINKLKERPKEEL